MESLTVPEALELLRLGEAAFLAYFQTWLTITFGTIVAVFAGRHLLTKSIKWLVSILYLLSSIWITAMIFYFADNNAQLGDVLRTQGVTITGIEPAAISFIVLFVSAVATTLYFIHMNPDAATRTKQT